MGHVGPCEFLFDEDICGHLRGKKVRVRFKATYDNGKWFDCTGLIESTRFQAHPGNPPVGEHEVAVSWTDSHTGVKPIHQNVDVCHLEPHRPNSKKTEVLLCCPFTTSCGRVLKGVYPLHQCKLSKQLAVISLGCDTKFTVPFHFVVSVE
jgi:hypothetical protein